jgi:hypothetical protein
MTNETPHELSPEHQGFREELEQNRQEHESLEAGIIGLGLTVGLTTGLMALFARQNQKEHENLQRQLDALLGEELVQLPAYSRSRPTLPGAR